MTLNIQLVPPERRAVALRLLFSRFPAEEQPTRLEDALRSAERGGLNFEGLLLAEENDHPVGVALLMLQADGMALIWPPVISCQASLPADVERELMTRLCVEIDRSGSKFAQCLLNPEDVNEAELLKHHGFSHAADIFFLARPVTAADQGLRSTDDGIEHDVFCEANQDQFAAVIERTYQASLDCPFLKDFRNGNEALASHRLSGQFNPSEWKLYRQGEQGVGTLLMNEHPDQDAMELTYFGIVPEFRGRGLGRKILIDAVRAAAIAGRSVIFLAVDCGNTYANALYSDFGFAELARRRVMIRSSGPVARE